MTEILQGLRLNRQRASWRRQLGCFIIALGQAFAFAGAVHAASPIAVDDPWFRYIISDVPAGGYMKLRNASDQNALLIRMSSPACGMLMAHKTQGKGGMESMVPVQEITVPAHGTFVFAQGGYHLMCVQPKMKPGQPVTVTLTFQDRQQVVASFAVYGANGAPSSH